MWYIRRQPMKRVVVAALLVFGLAGCTFATKHPAATAGIAAGTMGFTTCFIAVEKLDSCGAVGGVAALGIFGITWLATTFLVSNADELEEQEAQDSMRRVKSDGEPPGEYLPPEPNPLPATAIDAGVPMPDATIDASGAAAPVVP